MSSEIVTQINVICETAMSCQFDAISSLHCYETVFIAVCHKTDMNYPVASIYLQDFSNWYMVSGLSKVGIFTSFQCQIT